MNGGFCEKSMKCTTGPVGPRLLDDHWVPSVYGGLGRSGEGRGDFLLILEQRPSENKP